MAGTLSIATNNVATLRVEAERKRLGIVEPVKVAVPDPAPTPREYPPWEIEAREAADLLHHQLRERFPDAFVRTKALKIGISQDIVAAFPDVKPMHVGYYLARYCGCVPYLVASAQECALRYDLSGQPVGMVTPEEAVGSRARLAAKLKKHFAKRQAKATAEVRS